MAAFLVAGGVDCFLLLLRAPAQRPDLSDTLLSRSRGSSR
jgi:hypothetical protein